MHLDFPTFRDVLDPFPLTPALSLRERVNHFQSWRTNYALALRTRWLRFSLSLRERAGVRGKGASFTATARDLRCSAS